MTIVSSSHLRDVEWLPYEGTPEEGSLIITFYNGARYQYDRVERATYRELLDAPSQGEYFWANIRGVYPYAKL